MSGIKWAEKLVVLNDMAEVLLGQAYATKKILCNPEHPKYPPVCGDKKYAKLANILLKTYPELPRNSELYKEEEVMQADHMKMLESLTPFVDTIAGICELGEEIKSVIIEIASKALVLDVGVNPWLTRQFFTCLTNYAQMHIMISGNPQGAAPAPKDYCRNCKLILMAHSKATEFAGKHEERYTTAARFVTEFFDDPFVRMQQNFLSQSPTIASYVEKLVPFIEKAQDYHVSVTRDQAFSIWGSAAGAGRAAGTVSGPELATLPAVWQVQLFELIDGLEDWIRWVLYAFLLIPTEIPNAKFADKRYKMLATCLNQGTALVVHRDEWFHVFDLFKILDRQDKELKIEKQWALLKNKTKFFTITKVEAQIKNVDKRIRRRQILVDAMTQMDAFFSDMPGLLAPKALMVLTVVRAAQQEIMWHLRHVDVPRHKLWPDAKADPQRREYEEMKWLPDLVYLHDKLSCLLRANDDMIAFWHADLMKSLVAPKLAELMGTETWQRVPEVQELLKHCHAAIAAAAPGANFEGLRLDWSRITAFLSSQNMDPSSPKLTGDGVTEVNDLMRRQAMFSSRCVDDIPALLAEVSLAPALWCRNGFLKLHQLCLEPAKNAAVMPGSPKHAMAFVNAVAHFPLSVPQYLHQERTCVGETCMDLAHAMTSVTAQKARAHVEQIVHISDKLANQLNPMHGVVRVGADSSRRARAMPGSESHLSAIKPGAPGYTLNVLQLGLIELCAAIRDVGSIAVFDRVIHPREYLRKEICTGLRSALWRFTMLDMDFVQGLNQKRGSSTMQRPTKILEGITRYTRALAIVEDTTGLDVAQMLRAVLIQASYDDKYSRLQAFAADTPRPLTVPYLPPGSTMTLPRAVASYLVDLINHSVGVKGDVQYSSFFQGLVTGHMIDRVPKEGQARVFRAEEIFDINEFKALASIMGPYGIRVIDYALLKYLNSEMQRVQGWLTTRKQILAGFAASWVDEPKARKCCDTMLSTPTAADELLRPMINAGVVVAVRKTMYKALREVVFAANPILVQSASMCALFAANGISGGHDASLLETPELVAAASLSSALGDIDGGTDQALIASLGKLNETELNGNIWQLLPFAVASTFGQRTWHSDARGGDTSVPYLAHVGAFETNIHCIGHSLYTVVCSMEAINASRRAPAKDGTRPFMQSVADLCTKFIRCAAISIVRCSAENGERLAAKQYNTSAMYIFLDQFVSLVKHVVPRSVLEEVCPYDLIRSAYLYAHGLSDRLSESAEDTAVGLSGGGDDDDADGMGSSSKRDLAA